MSNTPVNPSPGPHAAKLVALDPEQNELVKHLAQLDPEASNPSLNNADLVNLFRYIAGQPNLLDTYNGNAQMALKHQTCQRKLKKLQEDLEFSQENSMELTTDVRRLKQALDNALSIQGAPGGSASSARTVKLPDPPQFEQGRENYRTWKAKLQEKVRIESDRFHNDDHHVAYAMGFLSGDAYKAVKPLRERGDIDTIAKLLTFLDATYEDPDPEGTAQAELKKLHQGNTEFAVHYSTFQRIMAILNYPPNIKKQCLRDTLSSEMKDGLVWIREPEDYDEWITLLQEIDQKLRSRNNSKKGKSGPPPAPNRATVSSGNAGYSKNPKDSWSNKEFTGAAPMDLSAQRRSQLRQETYDKRMQARVCTRCGDPKKDGHLRAQCPHKSMQLSAATAAKEAAEDSGEESGKE
jgi:hypothetical protein